MPDVGFSWVLIIVCVFVFVLSSATQVTSGP